jgi:P4 family phage/plasmid primase-like protien
MTDNNMSSSSITLKEFLSTHAASAGEEITHTRIGDRAANIYGGKYHIPSKELPQFHELYHRSVFRLGEVEYLTERQPSAHGPVLVDIDFRYKGIVDRQHDANNIVDIVAQYLVELGKIMQFEGGNTFAIYVMERSAPNQLRDKDMTKDGIHIVMSLCVPRKVQLFVRTQMIEAMDDISDLEISNTWSDVFDEGISKGCVNWQIFGSRKPGCDTYRITYKFVATWDTEAGALAMATDKIDNELSLKTFIDISAQNVDHLSPPIRDDAADYIAFEERSSPRRVASSGLLSASVSMSSLSTTYDGHGVTDAETLEAAVTEMLDSLEYNEGFVREIHEYAQVLPEKYYAPGTHLQNRKVAFALKRTDERRLFLSWVMLRAKANDFDYGTIPDLYREWASFDMSRSGVTRRSIMYWAKQDAREAYDALKAKSVDARVIESIYNGGDTIGDWDIAQIMFLMYKDRYICTSLKNTTWYVFKGHRWEMDEGMTLRLAISKDLCALYSAKQTDLMVARSALSADSPDASKLDAANKKCCKIMSMLKKTNDKNHIMREAMEIFFDREFIRNMDANPYLLCFTNGVFDFEQKLFRDGTPQDYLTNCTNVPYEPYTPASPTTTSNEIEEFMRQLFPKPRMCTYMWNHLAAALIGVKQEQVFNIYRGSGSNGKSILTDLMGRCLGDYKGTVPITLVTDRRTSIGSASPEVMQLKGIRYAVMQEPSEGATINEGMMKELTGGDTVQARALYSSSETFTTQFSLVVCTNSLFEVKSNDDGTWRRMKLVDFMSKFVDEGEAHTDSTKHVFPKDKKLKEKLPEWATCFVSMLVHRACLTGGEVKDCAEVVEASAAYRQCQDCMNGFIRDMIVPAEETSCKLGVKALNGAFKEWFQMNYGSRKMPKLSVLEDAMTKMHGERGKDKKWSGIQIRRDEEDDAPSF